MDMDKDETAGEKNVKTNLNAWRNGAYKPIKIGLYKNQSYQMGVHMIMDMDNWIEKMSCWEKFIPLTNIDSLSDVLIMDWSGWIMVDR